MSDNPRGWTYVAIFVGLVVVVIYDIGQDIILTIVRHSDEDITVLWSKTGAFAAAVALGLFMFHRMSATLKKQASVNNQAVSVGDPLSNLRTTVQNSPIERKPIQMIMADVYVVAFLIFAASMVVVIQFIPFDVAQQDHPQNHVVSIPNPLFKQENMTLVTSMSAHTFSAHEPITVSVQLYHDNLAAYYFGNDANFTHVDWSKVVYRISFEDTYCDSPVYGVYTGCYFDLHYDKATLSWGNSSRTITYSVSGGHDIFLFNQTTSDLQFREGIMTSKVGKPFIQTESIAASNSVRIAQDTFTGWKLVASIAIIALAVGILSFYQRIRKSLLNRFGQKFSI